MKGKQIMRNSKQNHTLTHRQTDTTKPLLHSNKNELARAVKVDTSANSNQRFRLNFLISLVHIENRTSKKKITFFAKPTTRVRLVGDDRRISKTNNHKQTLTKEKTQLSRKVSANKMSNLDADDGVAVHGAKEDFFEFSLNFCNTKLFFFIPRKERKK